MVAFTWVVASRYGDLPEADLTQLLGSVSHNGYFLSVTTFVTTVVCCALILGIIKLKKQAVVRDYLAIRVVTRRTMLKWIALLAGFIVLSDLITGLLGRPIVPEFMSEVYSTADPVWMIWVALIIAAPLFEETFFRGFLFRGFESSFMGTAGAVLLTAALWAVIHLQYDGYGVATIFCLGVLFGAARALTRSLLVPLGLHAAANLVATIEAWLLV